MMNNTCRRCLTAAQVLRRLGMRDDFSWGRMEGAPSESIHATFANAGKAHTRIETQEEYNRRVEMAKTEYREPAPFGQTIREYKLSTLCLFYASELAWLTAGRPNRATVYMAHPVAEIRTPRGAVVGNSFADNILEATCWLRYLRQVPHTELQRIVGVEYDIRPLIICPWLAGILPDDESPGGREGVIADGADAARLFDEIWLLGGRISSGMEVEAKSAMIVRDLTHLGPWSKYAPQTKPYVRAKLSPKRRS